MSKEFDVSNVAATLAARIGKPLLGLLAFVVSFPVLWLNEADIAQQKEALAEIKNGLVLAQVDQPTPSHNGKAIHATGKISTQEQIGDAPYLSSQPWLVLDRHVEMYQWVEDKFDISEWDGERTIIVTTYSYRQDWAEGRLDSETFHQPEGHKNPPIPLEFKSVQTPRSSFGQYQADEIIKNIADREPLALKESMLSTAHEQRIPGLSHPILAEDRLYFTREGTPSFDAPKFGDIRVSYQVLKPATYSVIARQQEITKLVSHVAENGRENFLVVAGTLTPQTMLHNAAKEASQLAMIWRGIGFAMMWGGLLMAANPLRILLSMFPFMSTAGSFLIFIMTLAISSTLSLATMVIAMMVYNPFVLALVLGLCAVGVACLVMLSQRKRAERGHPTSLNNAAPPNPKNPRPKNTAA